MGRETFFKPDKLQTTGFLDGLIRGMAEQGSQLWDNSFVKDLRDHLFESSPGRGGSDLVARNIQRGRDHGLPGYNKWREECGMKRIKSMSDRPAEVSSSNWRKIKTLYSS